MQLQYLQRSGKPKLAYVYTQNEGQSKGNRKPCPLVVFCGGYRSDMTGTKALYLEAQCRARGQAFLRFDYSGHGASEGRFEDGTIGAWYGDAADMLDFIAGKDPVVLAGSSMGGWIALLLATRWKGDVKGLVGIAAAPDFTEEIYRSLTPAQQKDLQEKGAASVENDYSDQPYHYTKLFYEEAKQHLLLHAQHDVIFPITLIQGKRDLDVPWQTVGAIQKSFPGAQGVFVEDGDHRLSRPQDLELIDREIQKICGF